jgi:hypothetical protein
MGKNDMGERRGRGVDMTGYGKKERKWLRIVQALEVGEFENMIPLSISVKFRNRHDALIVLRRHNRALQQDEVAFISVDDTGKLLDALEQGWDGSTWKVDKYSKYNEYRGKI